MALRDHRPGGAAAVRRDHRRRPLDLSFTGPAGGIVELHIRAESLPGLVTEMVGSLERTVAAWATVVATSPAATPTATSPTATSPTATSPTATSPTATSPTAISPTAISPTAISPTAISPTAISGPQ